MKCLVTGGAGFIGSHLCEKLLSAGHDVWALDNLAVGRKENIDHLSQHDKFAFFKCDLNRPPGLAHYLKGVDWVFHLAARADIVPSIQDPIAYYKANVTGTVKLLEACRKVKVKRFIYAASSSCYGIPDKIPTPETADIRCMYPYALTKNLGEQLVMHWNKVYGLPAVSLRLFNVYGPRARTSGTYGAVFGVFLSQLFHRKPLTVVGDGTQARDFTHVKDVARAFEVAAKSDISGEIFNIGTSLPQSVNTLVDLLQAKDVVYIPKRPGEPDVTCANNIKAMKCLGWAPRIPFEEGVGELLKNINAYKDAPLWETESIKEATKDWFKYLGDGK